MKNRLEHLESLVKGAMSGQSPKEIQSPGNIPSSDVSPQVGLRTEESDGVVLSRDETSGQVLTKQDETTYVGVKNWAAILEDVSPRI
jgi:hypothetical protein